MSDEGPHAEPAPDKHIDPERAAELQAAEERSRVAGAERADQIHFASESQRAAERAAELAAANGEGGVPPAATPGIEGVEQEPGKTANGPDSERSYGPVDRILLAELHELKALTDKQSVYQLAIIALLGVCATYLVVKTFRNYEPPDISGG